MRGAAGRSGRESGYTLVEVLVGMLVLSVASVGFYQVLFGSAEGADTARHVVRSSEEARLGFDRMVRDVRESQALLNPTDTSFTVQSDFNANGVIEPSPSAVPGSYEQLTYTFASGPSHDGEVRVGNGIQSETLMAGVDCIRKTDGSCRPVFTYSSSRLEYDVDGDGVTSAAELDAAPGLGNADGMLDGQEIDFVDQVSFALTVTSGSSSETYYAEAQLRNLR